MEDRYVKCGPKSPCQLVLTDPRLGADIAPMACYGGSDDCSASSYSRSQTNSFNEGDLVVFPSWLSHYVPPSLHVNQTEPRMSISFNAVVKLVPDNISDGQEEAVGKERHQASWSVRFNH